MLLLRVGEAAATALKGRLPARRRAVLQQKMSLDGPRISFSFSHPSFY
jgi:hypothetical protein